MKKIVPTLLLIFLLFSGFQKINDSKIVQKTNSVIENNDKGYTLMKQYCLSCHSETPGHKNNMIAPPMKGVQMHYKRKYENKKDFINAIVNWVKQPDKNKALMKGAVERFNLMPALPYSEDDVKLIASTLYKHNFGGMKNAGMKRGKMKCGNGKCGK